MNWKLLLEAVGKFTLLASLMAGAFLLYVFLEDAPFGIQIATAITYTAAVFCFVFFRWKGLPHSYSLWDKGVQKQLPQLLLIHGAFLLFVMTALTVIVGPKPYMLGYSFSNSGSKHHGLFTNLALVFFTVTFLSQVLISRGILRRNRRRQSATSNHRWPRPSFFDGV